MPENQGGPHYGKLFAHTEIETSRSLHSSEKLSRHNLQSRTILDKLADGWFWESVYTLIGVGSFVGMCIVFAVFNGRALPSWPLGITLNALISFLSTLSRAAWLVPVTASLSQTKWLHYRGRERSLYDMQLFDDASRGILGSLKCVFKRRGGIISVLSSIIFIAAILLDPFTQQVLTYPTRQVRRSDTASIAKSNTYTSSNIPNKAEFGNTVWADIYSGIFAPNITFMPFSLKCPTGNCEWPVYNQLAVCTNTVDVSSMVKVNCSLTDTSNPNTINPRYPAFAPSPLCAVTAPGYHPDTYISPGGYSTPIEAFPTVYFNRDDHDVLSIFPGDSPQVSASPPTSSSEKRAEVGGTTYSSILDGEVDYQLVSPIENGNYFTSLYTVYKRDSPLISPSNFTGFLVATQTIFALCTQSLKVQVTQGLPQVSISNSYIPTNPFANPTPPDADYAIFQFVAPGSSEKYRIEFGMLTTIMSYMSQALNSTATAMALSSTLAPWSDRNQSEAPTASDDLTWMPGYLEQVRKVADGLATSLTKNVQSLANETVPGDSFQGETYAHVRWRWLALHACFTLLSWILFLYAIFASHVAKIACWKGSVWPGVFLVDREAKAELGELMGSSKSVIDQRAKDIRVKLDGT